MDTAQKRHPKAGQMLRHRFIGRQHELLDDLMADIVLDEVGTGHAALLIELQLRLGHVELEGPPA